MPYWLPPLLLFAGVSQFIVGCAALVAMDFCEKFSAEKVLRWFVPVFVGLVSTGFLFIVLSHRLETERQRKLHFKAWSPPFVPSETEVVMDFSPPGEGTYWIALLDQKAIPPPAPGQADRVDCQILASDGTAESAYLDSNEGFFWQLGTLRRRMYVVQFGARAGTRYRLTVHPSSALSRQLTPSARVVIYYVSWSLNGLMFGAMILSAVGTGLWLVAYGVFIAAAVRIVLNGRDAAENHGAPRSENTPAEP